MMCFRSVLRRFIVFYCLSKQEEEDFEHRVHLAQQKVTYNAYRCTKEYRDCEEQHAKHQREDQGLLSVRETCFPDLPTPPQTLLLGDYLGERGGSTQRETTTSRLRVFDTDGLRAALACTSSL